MVLLVVVGVQTPEAISLWVALAAEVKAVAVLASPTILRHRLLTVKAFHFLLLPDSLVDGLELVMGLVMVTPPNL